jgi:hypothetical protein
MARKKKVSFWARKKISKPSVVKFVTSEGKLVRFKATKKITKPVKVTFYAKKRRRK